MQWTNLFVWYPAINIIFLYIFSYDSQAHRNLRSSNLRLVWIFVCKYLQHFITITNFARSIRRSNFSATNIKFRHFQFNKKLRYQKREHTEFLWIMFEANSLSYKCGLALVFHLLITKRRKHFETTELLDISVTAG